MFRIPKSTGPSVQESQKPRVFKEVDYHKDQSKGMSRTKKSTNSLRIKQYGAVKILNIYVV